MPQNQNDSENLEDVYDELDEPPSRLGMMTGTLVAIGVASLLIFTGVIWYAFNAGVSTGEEETLPVVRAEPGDVKVKPDDQAGPILRIRTRPFMTRSMAMRPGWNSFCRAQKNPVTNPRS
ncbi:MAG: hypothetical protein Dbin4_02421 [Alphaproteobacteria bacterium]|nr:hypothetical protein [Alphaproteobacteria bacterium]